MYVCVHVCVHTVCKCECLYEPEEDIQFPRDGTVVSCIDSLCSISYG